MKPRTRSLFQILILGLATVVFIAAAAATSPAPDNGPPHIAAGLGEVVGAPSGGAASAPGGPGGPSGGPAGGPSNAPSGGMASGPAGGAARPHAAAYGIMI